jgi:hypothetical protein
MLEPSVVYQAYHESAPVWRTSILREYLQLKTLQYVYDTVHGASLVFMGGTAIHLFTGSPRFSENLAFANRGVSVAQFRALAGDVARHFELENVACDVVVKERQGTTAVFRFTDVLQRWGLTGHRDSVLRQTGATDPQSPGRLRTGTADTALCASGAEIHRLAEQAAYDGARPLRHLLAGGTDEAGLRLS